MAPGVPGDPGGGGRRGSTGWQGEIPHPRAPQTRRGTGHNPASSASCLAVGHAFVIDRVDSHRHGETAVTRQTESQPSRSLCSGGRETHVNECVKRIRGDRRADTGARCRSAEGTGWGEGRGGPREAGPDRRGFGLTPWEKQSSVGTSAGGRAEARGARDSWPSCRLHT